MYFKLPDLLSYVSEYVTLYPGDLILTGTPSGIGPIKEGDSVKANLVQGGKEIVQMNFNVESGMPIAKF